MRIPRIYCDAELRENEQHLLPSDAAHHVVTVLRMGAGRPLVLFNGRGSEFCAVIVEASKKNVCVEIKEENKISRESPLMTELAIGISRGDRLDWVLQKATELGVTRIVPLFTERTEVKLSKERLKKKQEQWHKICVTACEQCQRNLLPYVAEAQSLVDYLSDSSADQKYVLHHRSQKKLSINQRTSSVALLVGPEGGLSDAEIELAQLHGFEPLTLGPRVMRTETAPLAALSLMQYVWGDLQGQSSPVL